MGKAVHGQAGPSVRKSPQPIARRAMEIQRRAVLVSWNDQQRQRPNRYTFGLHQRNRTLARLQRQRRNVVDGD
jgi:hypothetical protein